MERMESTVLTQRAARDAYQLCRCGCGERGLQDRADDAVLLAKGRQTAAELKLLLDAGERVQEQAEDLLWGWSRAESPLDDHVHGRPQVFLGTPSPRWVTAWREDAANLHRTHRRQSNWLHQMLGRLNPRWRTT